MSSTARPFSFTDTVPVLAATRIARLLVAAFDLSEELEVPLSDCQKIALLTSALVEFDGVQAEIDGLQRIERVLAELRDSNGRATFLGGDD